MAGSRAGWPPGRCTRCARPPPPVGRPAATTPRHSTLCLCTSRPANTQAVRSTWPSVPSQSRPAACPPTRPHQHPVPARTHPAGSWRPGPPVSFPVHSPVVSSRRRPKPEGDRQVCSPHHHTRPPALARLLSPRACSSAWQLVKASVRRLRFVSPLQSASHCQYSVRYLPSLSCSCSDRSPSCSSPSCCLRVRVRLLLLRLLLLPLHLLRRLLLRLLPLRLRLRANSPHSPPSPPSIAATPVRTVCRPPRAVSRPLQTSPDLHLLRPQTFPDLRLPQTTVRVIATPSLPAGQLFSSPSFSTCPLAHARIQAILGFVCCHLVLFLIAHIHPPFSPRSLPVLAKNVLSNRFCAPRTQVKPFTGSSAAAIPTDVQAGRDDA